MAEEFPTISEHLNINRRELLGTAVGTTAARIVPSVAPCEAAPVDSADALSKASAV